MSVIDWFVLIITLLAVITYGIYKSKSEKTLDGYFKSGNSMSWFLILLSIMGTQASAITFLSAPGQAYTDGMRFVQCCLATAAGTCPAGDRRRRDQKRIWSDR